MSRVTSEAQEPGAYAVRIPDLPHVASLARESRRLRRGRCEGWLCVLAYEHTLDTPIWNDPHDGCQDID